MDHQQHSLRLGAAVILCALVLRLGAIGLFQSLADVLLQPNISSFLLYLETGRVVRFSHSYAELPVFEGESPAPVFPTEAVPEPLSLPVFAPADGRAVEIRYNCSLRPDVEALAAQPLRWDLTGSEPTVLILSTHTTESYTPAPGEAYEESSDFRTLDEGYNMLSLGDHLAALLRAGGINVLQDRELHDYPSYNGSYSHARKSIQQYLEAYPSIRLVLDLHRDASGDNDRQMQTAVTVNGVSAARIMLVVGTNASGLDHPQWEENLSLALKLHTQLERNAPGICRYINLRSQRFNQDLSPGALIVEVGAAGDSHDEALAAVEVLAKAVLDLRNGSEAG